MLLPNTATLWDAPRGPVAVVLGLSRCSTLGGKREREHILISAVVVLTHLSLYRDIMAH